MVVTRMESRIENIEKEMQKFLNAMRSVEGKMNMMAEKFDARIDKLAGDMGSMFNCLKDIQKVLGKGQDDDDSYRSKQGEHFFENKDGESAGLVQFEKKEEEREIERKWDLFFNLLNSSSGTSQNSFNSSTVAFSTSNGSATLKSTTSATTPVAAPVPVFKLEASSVPSTSVSTVLSPSGFEPTEAKIKDSSFGNSTSMLFGGTSALASSGSGTSSGTSSAAVGSGSSSFGGTPSAGASSGSSIFGVVSPAIAGTGSSSLGSSSAATTGTGISFFGFSAGTTSSAATNQAQVSNPFSAGSAQASLNATGDSTSTQSIPTQFGTSSASTFGLAGNPAFSSGSSLFGFSNAVTKPFSLTPTFGLSSNSSAEANPVSSSSGPAASIFGSSWQAPKISTLFGSTLNSSSPSVRFQFGASAASAPTSSAPVFGSSNNATSSSIFSFTSAAAALSSQPAFGNANSVFAFGSTPSNNNDQMGMEDSMAEDTVQASTPAVPVFGQEPMSPSTGFVFGSTAPSGANPFQFGSKQSLVPPHNASPFQASRRLEFNAGGSFSLNSGGVAKSQRKILKVKGRYRKK